VTVRATTLKSAAAGRYYVEDLPRYYLEAGEPPGRWLGRGAALSGLAGEVDGEAFINVMAGLDPSGVSSWGRRYGDTSVRGYDVTCSAPKSVSVLWAVADPEVRAEVVAAHDAAVAAVVEFIDDQATTRPTINGEVVVVDARGVTAAAFRQHTSRAVDPQLHTHVVVAAKVQDPSGRWLALDGRMLKCDQRTLSAVYHAGLRAELTRRLGVTWTRPQDGIAELATIDQPVLEAFSKRTVQHSRRLAGKLERFEADMGRPPTPREYYRLDREAVTDSRPAKPSAQHPAVLHAGWRRELEVLGHDPTALAAATVGVARPAALGQAGVGAMVDQALAALAERHSTWRRNDLIRELARAVPTTLTLEPGQLSGWLADVADHVIATQLLEYSPPAPPGTPTRRDGRPITESTLDQRFTTPAVVAEEQRILDSAARRRARIGAPWSAIAADGLDVAQHTVARAVAGTEALVLVVGPAGTGKTTALRPAVEALRARHHFVVGAAPSATAAAVLQTETGMWSDTIDKLLLDHRTGRHDPFPSGTTVVVDEAGMLATPKLRELLDLADDHNWRVVLVGDPLQLSAVGRGGMFRLLCETHPTVQLEHVHRFAKRWERDASLALRAGQSEALAAYDTHGRLQGGPSRTIETQVLDRWDQLRSQGSVAVLCATNDTARRLNGRLQQRRLEHGELEGTRRRQLPNGQSLHVGDVVATRRNDRTLTTDTGTMVKNRARWTVQAINGDGSIGMRGHDGTVTVPAAYVDEAVELAYAETVHAAQGRTVDHALLIVDGPVDGPAIYVGLTRGRKTNEAYVAADGDERAVDVLEEAIARSWGDRPATEIVEVSPPARQAATRSSGLSL
jgi:conjugative relaxase-like TrwC/TraI family protein